MRLANKIGIVTAAASGMGRAGALRFAKEGAAVGVADIDQGRVEAVVAEITAAGGRALALVGDLRQDEFARDIVRANAICPGPIDTPMLRVFVARPDQQQAPGDQDKEALIIRRAQQVPMRRTGKPEEIANAALFLLSDEASYVSGASLPVDG